MEKPAERLGEIRHPAGRNSRPAGRMNVPSAREEARRFSEGEENAVGVRHSQEPAGVSLAHLSQRGDTRCRLMVSVAEDAVEARRFRAESWTALVRNCTHLTPVRHPRGGTTRGNWCQ
jgi:hypothetical protein